MDIKIELIADIIDDLIASDAQREVTIEFAEPDDTIENFEADSDDVVNDSDEEVNDSEEAEEGDQVNNDTTAGDIEDDKVIIFKRSNKRDEVKDPVDKTSNEE